MWTRLRCWSQCWGSPRAMRSRGRRRACRGCSQSTAAAVSSGPDACFRALARACAPRAFALLAPNLCKAAASGGGGSKHSIYLKLMLSPTPLLLTSLQLDCTRSRCSTCRTGCCRRRPARCCSGCRPRAAAPRTTTRSQTAAARRRRSPSAATTRRCWWGCRARSPRRRRQCAARGGRCAPATAQWRRRQRAFRHRRTQE
ncbi:MAG: hypothetical protein J3K34DRAFT_423542 [Monoraphidium minutum]|nr:MAG: hypothetical protein J3K34DRAFT_423542 [Monoraphidium minutum]